MSLLGGTYGSRERKISSNAQQGANFLACTRPNRWNSLTAFSGVQVGLRAKRSAVFSDCSVLLRVGYFRLASNLSRIVAKRGDH
jgi:hypothetical protein